MTVSDALFSTKATTWRTPQSVVDTLIAFWEGYFDLDPCADENYILPALAHETRRGLDIPWHGRVYINPPYGRSINRWIAKALMSRHSAEMILLLPARTDTRWFQPLFEYPICWVSGRLHFSESSAAAPFPSALVYLGPRAARFTATFGHFGPITLGCAQREFEQLVG